MLINEKNDENEEENFKKNMEIVKKDLNMIINKLNYK